MKSSHSPLFLYPDCTKLSQKRNTVKFRYLACEELKHDDRKDREKVGAAGSENDPGELKSYVCRFKFETFRIFARYVSKMTNLYRVDGYIGML